MEEGWAVCFLTYLGTVSLFTKRLYRLQRLFISNLMSTNRHKPQVPSCKPFNLHSCCYPFATNNSWHLSPATLPWPPLFSTSCVLSIALEILLINWGKIKLFCLFKNEAKTSCDKNKNLDSDSWTPVQKGLQRVSPHENSARDFWMNCRGESRSLNQKHMNIWVIAISLVTRCRTKVFLNLYE